MLHVVKLVQVVERLAELERNNTIYVAEPWTDAVDDA
jgi:hypothetical protein